MSWYNTIFKPVLVWLIRGIFAVRKNQSRKKYKRKKKLFKHLSRLIFLAILCCSKTFMFLNLVFTRNCFLLGFIRSEIDIHRDFRSYGYFTVMCRRVLIFPEVTNHHHILITYYTVDKFQNASKWKIKTALWRKTALRRMTMAHIHIPHCVLIHLKSTSGLVNIGAICKIQIPICIMQGWALMS